MWRRYLTHTHTHTHTHTSSISIYTEAHNLYRPSCMAISNTIMAFDEHHFTRFYEIAEVGRFFLEKTK